MLEHKMALLVMNMLPGIGPGRKRILSEYFGSCEAALEAPPSELCRLSGINGKLADVISHWERHCDVETEMSLVRRAGVRLVTEEDDDYPPLLRQIHDPPMCLYVLGDPACLKKSANGISIVGSRFTTMYGVHMADSLARSAAYAGWMVVSGLARGIDTAAHEATLAARGITAAVVGSGLLTMYPQENQRLAEAMVASGGAIISEYPMREKPMRGNFPLRNRIISGMTRGTIVVQAGLQSGSLITAAQALEQNRVVFAVPGPADVLQSRGCHALIRDGARLIESFDDVLEEFSVFPAMRKTGKQTENSVETAKTQQPELQMSPLEAKLWSLLENGEMALDDMIDESGEEPSSVMACLLTLELKRLVKQLPGKRIVRI